VRPVGAASVPKGRLTGGLAGRMLLASGLLIVVVAAVFGVLLFAIYDLQQSANVARDTREELIVLDAVEKLVIDLETGLRGYVITGERPFLAPWNAASTALPQRTGALERIVADNAGQARRARAISRDVRSYIVDYGLPLIAATRRGGESTRSVASTQEGKRRVDELRAQFATFRATERALLTERQDSADTAARRAVVGAIVGLAGSVALIVLLAGYFMRAIFRPVRRAAAMAERLAGGDLAARMPEGDVGEIGALERSFNTMAGSLEASVEQQSALRRVATLVAQAVSPSEIFEVVTREVGLLSRADLARMERYEADGTVTGVAAWGKDVDRLAVGTRIALEGVSIAALVRETNRPVRVDSFAQASGPIAQEARKLGIRSSVGCPIVVSGRLWGVIACSSKGEEPFAADAESQIGEFTELVGTAIANAEARAELAASRARVVAASDDTRRRLERDLHDGAQQRLVSLALRLRAAASGVPAHLSDVHDELTQVGTELDAVLADLREISRGIHPAILAEGGIGSALKTLARRSPVPVELQVRADARLPERVEVTAYYVVSEALTNVAKHSQASAVHVDVDAEDGLVRLAIRDDGIGGADPGRGSGLIGLKDRVEATGGRMTVDSRPGEGTLLLFELPVDAGGVDPPTSR
jgi:signal transduction histidine kinase